MDSGTDAGDSGQPEDAGEDAGVTDAGVDGGDITLPDGGSCTTNNGACSEAGDCCSGYCNGTTCGPVLFCGQVGVTCDSNTDCCSGTCSGGTCSADRCNDNGQNCGIGADCCSGVCSGTTCIQQAGAACLALGATCDAANDTCCSSNCRNGKCERASSCQAQGDVCYADSECCSALCTATGGNAGVCSSASGFCQPAGLPCESGQGCCTRICADPGSGQKVCQSAASGCKVSGETCAGNSQCCGGEPEGDVACVVDANNSYCDNGQSCNEVGSVCGKPVNVAGECARDRNGLCISLNINTNCCNGINISGGRDLTCRLDSVGVPRCFGQGDAGTTLCPAGYTGEEPCCIPAGDVCRFSDQCCGGAPCLEDDEGVRRCTVSACIALGDSCVPGTGGPNDGCCSGACLATSEITYACQLPVAQPDGGGCQSNGESCTTSGQCCSGICNGTQCVADTCQGTGATCAGNGDCCSGLSCEIPAGSSTGTCKTATQTCGNEGQACSPTSPCCGEGSIRQCLNPQGAPCNGTTACACEFIFGKRDESGGVSAQ